MEELEKNTEEKIIQKKELRRKIKEKLSFTTEKYRKEADRKITESVLELKEYKSADCVFCYVSTGERNGYIFYIARYSPIRKASWSAKVYGKRNYERIRDPFITRVVSGCIWNP